MKLFVLIVAIINLDGEFEVSHSIVDECPERVLFTAIMEDRRIHREFLGWSATCAEFDKQRMIGRPPL